MKKYLIGAVVLASFAAHAEFFSGNDLLGKLDADNSVDRMVALGYIMGVADTTRGIEQCSPEGVTAGQMRDMVRNHLVASPAVRHFTADLQVRYVLKTAWPCPKKKNSSGDI